MDVVLIPVYVQESPNGMTFPYAIVVKKEERVYVAIVRYADSTNASAYWKNKI